MVVEVIDEQAQRLVAGVELDSLGNASGVRG